jgi:hypothetical protein
MDMPGASIALLRAGLALKLSHIRLATRSYLRDRTHQATDTVASYAVAAGFFAAASVFLIAACFVGIVAMFRWIEIRYGMFQAFGAVGALLLAIAAILAAVAAGKLNRVPPRFPTLSSRLRVAIKAGPAEPDRVESTRETAAAILRAPPSPMSSRIWTKPGFRSRRDNRQVQAGLILMATLLSWAAVRRRQLRRTAPNVRPTT